MKEPYESEAAARAAAKGISQRDHQHMRAYWCDVCFLWHLTSSGKHKRPNRPPARYSYQKYPNRYRQELMIKPQKRK